LGNFYLTQNAVARQEALADGKTAFPELAIVELGLLQRPF
jgi:hypothetical protein